VSDQLAPFALWTALPPSLAGRCSGDYYLHKLTVTEGPGTSALAFPPDGRTLATGAVNGKVRLWDPRTGTARRTWVAQAGSVLSTVYSPEGTLMATSGADGTAALWDATPESRSARR
jgi:WD40 repeat protein